jgi:hypothetical protein
MASNFNNSTPAAAAGSKNVVFATDGAGNDSGAYVAPYDVNVFTAGLNTNNQRIWRQQPTRACKFPASATNSLAIGRVASTGTVVYTIAKNGVGFATITFTSSATGVWAQASDATFNGTSDLLEIDGPATADGTLADVSINLWGYQT